MTHGFAEDGARLRPYDLDYLRSLIGKYIRIDYPDGTGGGGTVVEVYDYPGKGKPVEIAVDYGYSFALIDGTKITVTTKEG